MLMLSIIFLLSSNAATLRRDKSILYARIVITILVSCFILCINSYCTCFHRDGLGPFVGLYHTTTIAHIFQMFIILIAGGLMLNQINVKPNPKCFAQEFKFFIKFIWNNKLNYALYVILICPIIYILGVSYTAMFNFNVDSPFILHLIRLLTIYPIISTISTYIITYVFKKQIICFRDALKSITFNKFILLTFFYFFGVYLGFNGYVLSFTIPLFSNIFMVMFDVTFDFFRLHSLPGNLLNKLSGNFIITNKVSKFIVYKGSAYNNNTTSMRVIKYKFIPKITLNGFYSNSLFNNMLPASSKSNIATFLDKNLYSSKLLEIKGLDCKFKLVKFNSQLYAKINLYSNKCMFVSTNLEFIKLINGIGFSNNYTNNTKLALSTDVSPQNHKNNIKLNNVNIKKIEYKMEGVDKVKDTLKLGKLNEINTNKNLIVYMMPNIIYDNPYLNVTNLSYDYHNISDETLITLRNQLPVGIRNHGLVDNMFISMNYLRITVNNIKLFLFNNHILIELINGKLNLPNRVQLNQLVEVFTGSMNNVLRTCIINILFFQDPTPLENIITWIYVNIGVKYPLITSMDILNKAKLIAKELEMEQHIEYEKRTKLLFGLSSERVGYDFTLYEENYHEYSERIGNFTDEGYEYRANPDIDIHAWNRSPANIVPINELEQVLNLNKCKLNPDDANQLESYSLGQIQVITEGAAFAVQTMGLYDRSTLTISNINDVADFLESRSRRVNRPVHREIRLKDLDITDTHLNVSSTIVTYLMNKTNVISDLNNPSFWKKLQNNILLHYKEISIDEFLHSIRNDH